METLSEQFKSTLGNIEVNGPKHARAIAAHVEVRTLLETSATLRRWGANTVLIGSYARGTGIYPGNDVDIFTKLEKLDTTAPPSEVFESVRDILTHHYGTRAKPQARSVKIMFSHDATDDFSVDVVPAVRCGERWAIPTHDPEAWRREEGRWVETDPEHLTVLTTKMNSTVLVSGQGAYVPVVKLMRQARSQHRGDAKPGGLFIELATYDSFRNGVVGDSFAELFAGALTSVASRLVAARSSPLIDPALGTPYSPAPEVADLAATATVFSTLAELASQALRADRCKAAVLWRQILGTNDRGQVFPLPPGCDETGAAVSAVTTNRGRGSDEARGFG
jgi:hypothetical protein